MSSNVIAVYPGTFDPMTLGHEDVVRRATQLFSRVIVAVAAGHHKKALFTLQERIDMASMSCFDGMYRSWGRIIANQGVAVAMIYDRVWGYDFGPDSKALAVYIGYLRRKLEDAGEPRIIHTGRGVGYTMRAP